MGRPALTLALANSRGWLDYEAPVARYWPGFAQNGKAEITVRQLLGHEAGLVVLDEPLAGGRQGGGAQNTGSGHAGSRRAMPSPSDLPP